MGQFAPFGQLLRGLLAAKEWNASDLARQLGVNRGTVNRWVNDDTLPTRETVRKIADLFGLTGLERYQLYAVWMGDT